MNSLNMLLQRIEALPDGEDDSALRAHLEFLLLSESITRETYDQVRTLLQTPVRLACRVCDRSDCDGISKAMIQGAIASGWQDIVRVQSLAESIRSCPPGDERLLDWYTHLGTCPDCRYDDITKLKEALRRTKAREADLPGIVQTARETLQAMFGRREITREQLEGLLGILDESNC